MSPRKRSELQRTEDSTCYTSITTTTDSPLTRSSPLPGTGSPASKTFFAKPRHKNRVSKLTDSPLTVTK